MGGFFNIKPNNEAVTGTIEAKLDYKNYRVYKKIENINEFYKKIKSLKSGSFGTVYEAVHIATNCPCAVKQIAKKSFENQEIMEKLMWQEIKAYDNYDHPNIVRVLDFCEDAEFIYIVFELIETGDLSKNIKLIKEKLPTQSRQAIEGVVANLMHQIILAIGYLHK